MRVKLPECSESRCLFPRSCLGDGRGVLSETSIESPLYQPKWSIFVQAPPKRYPTLLRIQTLWTGSHHRMPFASIKLVPHIPVIRNQLSDLHASLSPSPSRQFSPLSPVASSPKRTIAESPIKMARCPLSGGLSVWSGTGVEHTEKVREISSDVNCCGSVVAPQNGTLSPTSDTPQKDVSYNSHPLYFSVMNPLPTKLTLEERFALCMSVAEECIQPEELKQLLERKAHPICYDGFEPSGRMHLAQGILKSASVNKLTDCGCIFVFYIADWFAMLNNKLGGDLAKIQQMGLYFVEVWKASGMRMDNVKFVWASDNINSNSASYWKRVMNISRSFSITRIKRCGQIMGRGEGDDMAASHILYPCMQCSDIFELKADICQLGMDQRKVNMLAREYCDEMQMKQKPVILSHGMLPGLLEGQEKMSKSDSDSAIFMDDSETDVRRKLKKAFCPPGQLEGNPCVSYAVMLIFPRFGVLRVRRPEFNGGDVEYKSVEEFKSAFESRALHPGDLKSALAKYINDLLTPVRDHFQNDPNAKKVLDQIKQYEVTR